MAKNPPKAVGLLQQFLSIARSILTNQVDLPSGILRLDATLYWLAQHDIKPLTDDEWELVEAYHAQIINFPLGEERLAWEPSALQKVSEELEQLNNLYRPQLLTLLNRVVNEQVL
ncbi:hypothetical protein [Hymenobacter metallicola]|uniref:DUF2489 domain-containing protein n=1 Tax=Hymenobacter metallicola TaxID=2563114 RepID=A0A4Z0QEK7_9BACT|nr:hypothetical protein [Hymenobacter metallicola]TGE28477.1 hypothetical protein E5K02_03140 [Hymenobacter metallicola]